MVYKCINQPVWLDWVCVNIWTRSLYGTFLNTRISSKWESVLELYLFFGAFLPVHLLPIQRFLQRFWTTCLLINSENIHIHFGNIDTQQTQCCFINRLHSGLLGVFHHAALLCFWKQTSGKFLLLLQLNSFNEIICQPPLCCLPDRISSPEADVGWCPGMQPAPKHLQLRNAFAFAFFPHLSFWFQLKYGKIVNVVLGKQAVR